MPRIPNRHPVDVHLGKKLQAQRSLCGLSQSELAEQLDITFQQLQKYESGANRVSASRLWQASTVLDAPVSYFFTGFDEAADPTTEILCTRAGLELVRDFEGCSKEVQEFVSLLSKAAAFDCSPNPSKKAK
jgi:transcriptional regulator with XRE-family HTH domain